ncbi:MAG: hypothetical protein CO094_07570 [Anaerolineae bacterium CG_4_9_14_3_um_filter_57_17]|nr:hypothetical protein [bacterium]NCT22202.1 hypothetical protein [bacterium]OIO85342.1 MAG: hypothetical protein AUK01_06370 [Anaerolineae bacterium CG2_30_57_67]PJB66310.1 MAG: hypothetical protein CO094_07570 [Anaerolineae bacterium CG_4_9_14_3_um_filter_57_17]
MLTADQVSILEAPLNQKIFLTGPAGCGKTTAAVERMRALLNAGIPNASILILTPQRTLQAPYFDLLNSPERAAGEEATPATLGGLAHRLCQRFWPLVGEAAGFSHPERGPQFLTLETAQYYMAQVTRPLFEQGYFDSVTIDRNRLYSQIIDNLNKAAVVGFPYSEIGARLDAAYFGEPVQRRIYADAQECATRFRHYCLENNLLDFSLQLEIFVNLLWPHPITRQFLTSSYRHLIYDNVEEDGARVHDLMREWLPEFDSALLIYDESAGYRRFLGADLPTGLALADLCAETVEMRHSFVVSPAIARLESSLVNVIAPEVYSPLEALAGEEDAEDAQEKPWEILAARFYPQLLESIAEQVACLLEAGTPAAEIVILAPYLSDALRFSLMNRLTARGVPARSHRPSRSLRDEPASQALLTLACLAHPGWKIFPPQFDVACALMQAISGLDLVRAQLLTDITYRPRDGAFSAFEDIRPQMQERITYTLGERFARLRAWLLDYQQGAPLPFDHFLRKLFGETLSQPGFGFHHNFDSIRVAANLIESVQKFRQALNLLDEEQTPSVGREYLLMLREGVLAAQYITDWQAEQDDAVLVAPATTFLLMNRPATVQFWLDAGSSGWYERLAQPITHPYVLARGWETSAGRTWNDADEVAANRDSLARLVSGLLRRCRRKIVLCLPEMDESGYEQRGDLLRAFQKILL